MLNIFEKGTRERLRFMSSKGGSLNIEDLWDLSLEELDNIAKALNRQVKDSSEESFIKKQNTSNKRAQLQFDIVISIINTKMEEAAKRIAASDRKAKRDKILGLIAEKQEGALAKKSITSLQAELDKLDVDDEVED